MRIDSRLHGPLLKYALALAGIALAVGPAQAALDDVGNAPPSTLRVKFVVDPQLSAGTNGNEIGRRLSQYVADLNTVFVRESVRSFAFDPATDLMFVDPATQTGCVPGPTHNVAGEVRICITKSPLNYSHGGNAGSRTNPVSGSIFNLKWLTVHDPLRLSKTTAPPATVSSEEDYVQRQFRTLVHELEHIYGAGMGEYYNLATGTDRTGVAPLHNLALSNRVDPYWWSRQHWRLDPLLGQIYGYYGPATSRVSALQAIRFNAGTKAHINTDWSKWPYAFDSNYFNPLTQATEVWIADPLTDAPVAGAQVTVWRVPQPPSAAITQVAQGSTDAVGRFVFNWQCSPNCFNNYSGILLVKATAPQRDPAATWFSIFDGFEQKAAFGQNAISIDLPMPLSGADTQPPAVTVTAPASAVLGQPLTISASASDASGIESVRLLAPGGEWGCTRVAPPYTCSFVPVVGGPQAVIAIARDRTGKTSQHTQNVVFNPPADAVAPSASLTAPANAAVGAAQSISVTASDNIAVARVEILIDGRSLCTRTAVPYQCAWTPAAAGYANIEAQASDAAGNSFSVSANTRVQ